ncbi:cag pathogenicity island Cag12 family protein [Yersinia enterocolitica]|uniref:cag pathogenicity island Cag12 family protein n=1 Tax=Yersiniaceae TaxID=1903411 RepID=UPI0039B04D73|nr:conjugal transfer protein [Escherichia coli]
MKKVVLTALLFLSACSSPPEPPQVDWKQDPATMNSQLMDWQPTFTVIKSDRVNSSWVKLIRNFSPENRLYSDDVFFAVAHSDSVIVESSRGDDFFTAKNWLRSNGAYGLIQYRYKPDDFGIKSINIYLQKKG